MSQPTNSDTVNKKYSRFEKLDKKLEKPFYSLLSITIGFSVAFIIILIIGGNPLLFVANIFRGNFYSWAAFGNFLATFSWMLLLGLSVSIAFKSGLFNIGVAGQMIGGGIAGIMWAFYGPDLGRASIIFSIFIPMLVGMLIAMFIAMLKISFRINEVVSSIMLNWIIYYIYKFITNPAYFDHIDTSSGATNQISPNDSLRADWLTNMFGETSFINLGIFIALFVFILVVFFYKFTLWGRKSDLLGANPNSAKYIGIKQNKEIMKKMALSGALAGLAGSIYYLGVKELLPPIGLDIPGEGFNGITISLLAFNNPIGVFFSAFFVAMLFNSKLMVSSALNPRITTLILGIIILTISLSQFIMIYKPVAKIRNKYKRKKRDTGSLTPATSTSQTDSISKDDNVLSPSEYVVKHYDKKREYNDDLFNEQSLSWKDNEETEDYLRRLIDYELDTEYDSIDKKILDTEENNIIKHIVEKNIEDDNEDVSSLSNLIDIFNFDDVENDNDRRLK